MNDSEQNKVATSINKMASAITEALESVNVLDSNLERANLVDVTDKLASAMQYQADGTHLVALAIKRHAEEMSRLVEAVERMRPVRSPTAIPLPN
ncbi:MAG TPA: hypothetical protein VN688_02020 [Gemmataceae bacterium]|nr:hypothetical protein [Gemmataceae bacterium]